MKSRLGKWLLRLFKVLVLLCVIYYISIKIDFPRMEAYLKRMDLYFLAAGILFCVAGMALNLSKWKLMLSSYYNASWNDVLRSMFGGYALSIFTPARIGELGRCFFIKSLDKKKTVSLVGIDKAFNVAITTFLGIFFIQFMPIKYSFLVKIVVYLCSAVIMWFIVMYTRYPKKLYGLLMGIPLLRKKAGRDLLVAVKNSNRQDNLKYFFLSLVMYLAYLFEFVCFSMAFSKGSFHIALNAYVISLFLKTTFPLTVADWGIKEVSMIEFYRYFGLSSEIALGAASFLYLFNILMPALIGALVIMKNRGAVKNETE